MSWRRNSSKIPKDSAQSQTFGHNSISLTWFSMLAANLSFAIVYSRHWIVEVLPPKPAFTDSRGNRHRHLRYLDHSPPYQMGRVACGQSSVLVFEWEWCAIDKDLELA